MVWLTTAIIMTCFGIGGYFAYSPSQQDNIDSPIEEVVESVLRNNGIEYDFSADKKEALKEESKKQ